MLFRSSKTSSMRTSQASWSACCSCWVSTSKYACPTVKSYSLLLSQCAKHGFICWLTQIILFICFGISDENTTPFDGCDELFHPHRRGIDIEQFRSSDNHHIDIPLF